MMNPSAMDINEDEMITVSPIQRNKQQIHDSKNNSNDNAAIFHQAPPPIVRRRNVMDQERDLPPSAARLLLSMETPKHKNTNEKEEEENSEEMQILSPSDNNNFNTLDSSFIAVPRGLQRNEGTIRGDLENEDEDESEEGGNINDQQQQQQPRGEKDEERRQREEEEESIRLAQQLMAEEAMASYRASADFLRMNSDQFSEEDFAALQNALQEEEYDANEEALAEAEDEEGNLDYDALLELGERIGDVKTSRWQMKAEQEIAKLEQFQYDSEKKEAMKKEKDNISLDKCLVCYCEYEDGQNIRGLPCGHWFHKECIDRWLQEKDWCALCKKSICGSQEETKEASCE